MFKEKFKYYKRKMPPPSLGDVINMKSSNSHLLSKIKLNQTDNTEAGWNKYGLKNPSTWEVYELKQCSGFVYIVNPFTSSGQRFWISRSLADYSNKPSMTNLDNQTDVEEILGEYTWWEISSGKSDHKHLKKRLRWATMGYHHNWDTKVYSESLRDPFPNDLNQLSQYIIAMVFGIEFRAEACIVNFYHMDSSLFGHTDRSEQNSQAPLISFSFGQTAIFLLGGLTLEETAHAIAIESGDIAIMTGDSRLRYHGVPRILPASQEPWNDFQEFQNIDLNCNIYPVSFRKTNDSISWKPFADYIKNSRVNINVRQVLLPTQMSLNDDNKYS